MTQQTRSDFITDVGTTLVTGGKNTAAEVRGLLEDLADSTSFLLDDPDAVTISLTVDGGGSAITTGSKGYVSIPYAMTLQGWTILADQTGSVVIDVKKATYAGFPTTASIAGSEKPTLSSARKNTDGTLSSWTTTVSAGDIIEFNVDSAATVERVNLVVYGVKT
jgi:hypothetical protein